MVNHPELLDQLVRDRRGSLAVPAARRLAPRRRRSSVRIAIAGGLRLVARRLDPCPSPC